jgi:hypothetical protein
VNSANSGGTTVSGFYRPSIIGVLQAAAVSNASSITVTAATATELLRLYALGITTANLIGYDSGNSTFRSAAITSITGGYGGSGNATTITCTVATIGSMSMLPGTFIVPNDGSQYPVTFVDEQFGLNVIDNYGNTVAAGNSSGNNALYAAPFPRVPLAGGIVNVLNIVNYPSTALNSLYGTANYTTAQLLTLSAWIKSNLNSGGGVTTVASATGNVNYGGKFNFTDDYGL